MKLQEWSDKQVRKADLRHAILETYFQSGMIRMSAAALRVNMSDEKLLYQFLPEYLETLISALRESQANLWGFKGKVEWVEDTPWTGALPLHPGEYVPIQRTGSFNYNLLQNERRERFNLAVNLISPLEKRIGSILLTLKEAPSKSDYQLAQETCAAVLSAMDTFHENCAAYILQLVEKDSADGLIKQTDVAKLKVLAERRVGDFMRKTVHQ
jgi:hypothetical protein